MTLDARLEPGLAAFDRGEFFAAHELWEDVWRGLAGDDRLIVQGLIQIAVGLHHLQGGRMRPAAGVLARGVSKLSRRPQAPASPRALAATRPIAALARDVARVLSVLDCFLSTGR
jgi:uncharacterized protein